MSTTGIPSKEIAPQQLIQRLLPRRALLKILINLTVVRGDVKGPTRAAQPRSELSYDQTPYMSHTSTYSEMLH